MRLSRAYSDDRLQRFALMPTQLQKANLASSLLRLSAYIEKSRPRELVLEIAREARYFCEIIGQGHIDLVLLYQIDQMLGIIISSNNDCRVHAKDIQSLSMKLIEVESVGR